VNNCGAQVDARYGFQAEAAAGKAIDAAQISIVPFWWLPPVDALRGSLHDRAA
jgi:hypothetical protein